jgi:PGF-pre-PGF domain-containing protein
MQTVALSSSGGSSGSGTIPVSTIASQVFTNLGAGQHTMSISSTQIAITQILFTLNTALTGNHLVSVQRIASLPTFIPSNQGTIFQYIRIDKGVISDSNLSSVKISFRIERNWLTSNNMDPENIVLYRYTQQWDALATRRTTSDSTYYYYEADSPGMSYFSIRAYELPPASPSPTPPPAQAPTPPPPTGDLVREVEHPKNLAKKDIGFTWVFIPFILTGLFAGLGVSFLLYQRKFSILDDAELRELTAYIRNCKAEGVEFSHIKSVLIKAGWADFIVDLAIYEVHVPGEDLSKIKGYHDYMKEKGKTEEEIINNLKKAGWQEEVIEEALKPPKPVPAKPKKII